MTDKNPTPRADNPPDKPAKKKFVGMDKKSHDMPKVKDGEESDLAVGGNDSVKDLLEKNLKWSQIIYEQNRKIRRTLLWNAIGGWIRILIFVIPFVIAGIYLWPMYKNAQGQLFDLLTGVNPISQTASVEDNNAALKNLMKVLPLTNDQQDQIKALMDNNSTQ